MYMCVNQFFLSYSHPHSLEIFMCFGLDLINHQAAGNFRVLYSALN